MCSRGGFIIQRHNELRDLEAKMLNMVCNAVQFEPVLQEINGEVLTPVRTEQRTSGLTFTLVASGSGKALPFSTLRFVTRMQSHIKASPQNKSTASMTLRRRECEENVRSRVLEVEQGSLTPLVLSLIFSPEVCAVVLERLTLYAKSSAEHYR